MSFINPNNGAISIRALEPERIGFVNTFTMEVTPVVEMTINQMWGLWCKFKQSPDGSPDFMSFMERAVPMFMGDGGIMIQWCGMWLGIEGNSHGEAHS